MAIYPESKFTQLLGAHWWRRQLQGQCDVVAVSPGLIPETGLGRHGNLSMAMPDAKTVPEGECWLSPSSCLTALACADLYDAYVGAQSILRAFTRDDFPADPEQIFLTSWGEWWPKDVFEKSLDKGLQDKWCPGKEQIEAEEGI